MFCNLKLKSSTIIVNNEIINGKCYGSGWPTNDLHGPPTFNYIISCDDFNHMICKMAMRLWMQERLAASGPSTYAKTIPSQNLEQKIHPNEQKYQV
jgi:hypothetical protein